MRRRILFFTITLAVLVSAMLFAQFVPQTMTMDTVGMTGTQAATTSEFKPQTLTMDTVGMTGTQATTTSTEFKPQILNMDVVGMTGGTP